MLIFVYLLTKSSTTIIINTRLKNINLYGCSLEATPFAHRLLPARPLCVVNYVCTTPFKKASYFARARRARAVNVWPATLNPSLGTRPEPKPHFIHRVFFFRFDRKGMIYEVYMYLPNHS